MPYRRLLCVLAAAAALAACSGNIGGGQSTLPGTGPNGQTNPQGLGVAPAPTASPVSASNVATIGDTLGAQALPQVMGWGGTIAFAKPTPAPSPSPGGSPAPAPGAPISIGITAAVVEPSDAPHFNHGAGKHVDTAGSKGLLFISLLATADVTLAQYPAIAVDVPREVVAKYRNHPFALALYDPHTKEKAYRLAVAERDLSSPAPGAATPVPTPAPTVPPTGSPGGPYPPNAFTPPPLGTGLDAGGLPPEHVAFVATPSLLTLHANEPVIFALYAAPVPAASPSPTATASASGEGTTASPSPSSSPTTH